MLRFIFALLTALAWSPLLQAGPKEEAQASFDNFFPAFVADYPRRGPSILQGCAFKPCSRQGHAAEFFRLGSVGQRDIDIGIVAG